MALYIARSIFHLARLLYVRPQTFGSTFVYQRLHVLAHKVHNLAAKPEGFLTVLSREVLERLDRRDLISVVE